MQRHCARECFAGAQHDGCGDTYSGAQQEPNLVAGKIPRKLELTECQRKVTGYGKEPYVEVKGKLEGRQVFLLHGVPYHRVFFTHLDDPETVRQCQLAESEFDDDLTVGNPIRITYLLKTVLEIRRHTTGPS